MHEIIKYTGTEILKKQGTKEIIKKVLDILKKSSYINEEAVQLAAYGRYLKNLGTAIENHASEQAVRYLDKNQINIDVSDLNLSFREYFDKIYPKDQLIQKYEKDIAEKEAELKQLKDSVKNRQQKLELDGQVVKILKNKSLSIRQK